MILQGGSTSPPDQASARRWWCDVLGSNHWKRAGRTIRVADGVKMTAKLYIDFIKEHLVPWHKKKNLSFRKKMVFMHDNAPSHAARLTTEYLQSVFARHGKIMQWPACSPDLDPIENLWSILKRKLYSGGRQYTSKDDLWKAILTAAKDISSDDIESLTSSMDQRLFSLIHKNGNYIQY